MAFNYLITGIFSFEYMHRVTVGLASSHIGKRFWYMLTGRIETDEPVSTISSTS